MMSHSGDKSWQSSDKAQPSAAETSSKETSLNHAQEATSPLAEWAPTLVDQGNTGFCWL